MQRQLSNGRWVTETRINKFVECAVETEKWLAPLEQREPRTTQGILDALAAGEEIRYDSDWYAKIRDADTQKQPQAQKPDYPNGRRLDCGCTVYSAIEIMNASLGSSCANCYDRMS